MFDRFSSICFAAANEAPQTSSGTAGTVPGASVVLQNPVSHDSQAAKTDAQGKFEFVNVPSSRFHWFSELLLL